jgi:hypothetical protein
MVVDFLRMASTETVRFYRDSEEMQRVRWYRALPGAQALPFATAFGSHVWDDARRKLNPDVGQQQGPREWAPTDYLWAPPGDHYHGPADWFLSGIPLSELSNPSLSPDPLCEPPMLNVRYTDDSLIIPDVVEVDIDKDRGLVLLADLGAGIAHLTTQDADQVHVGVVSLLDQQLGAGAKGVDRLSVGQITPPGSPYETLGATAIMGGSLFVKKLNPLATGWLRSAPRSARRLRWSATTWPGCRGWGASRRPTQER